MKAFVQYFPVMLFIMLYEVVYILGVCGCMKSYSMTIQMKAIEQYFPMMLFIMLYIEDITCPRVDRHFIFKCSTRYQRTSEISN